MTSNSISKAADAYLPVQITNFFSRGASLLPTSMYTIGFTIIAGIGVIYALRQYVNHRQQITHLRAPAAEATQRDAALNQTAHRVDQSALDHFDIAA